MPATDWRASIYSQALASTSATRALTTRGAPRPEARTGRWRCRFPEPLSLRPPRRCPLEVAPHPEERNQDHATRPMRPPWLGALEGATGSKVIHTAHIRATSVAGGRTTRWDNQGNERRQHETPDHDMQTAPPARPPGAGIRARSGARHSSSILVPHGGGGRGGPFQDPSNEKCATRRPKTKTPAGAFLQESLVSVGGEGSWRTPPPDAPILHQAIGPSEPRGPDEAWHRHELGGHRERHQTGNRMRIAGPTSSGPPQRT